MASIHTEKGVAPDHIIKTPIWMLVIRVFQFLLALIIVGLAGTLIHQAYLDEEGLALAIVRSPPAASLLFYKHLGLT